jgi:PAS domain S-box-containing protein
MTGSGLRITLLYVGIGVLWVLASDLALGQLTVIPGLLTYLELLKGGAFVVITALVLHLVLRREFQKLERRDAQIQGVEERLRLLTTALEAAANGIVITDRDGRITWTNPAFTRLTGYSAEEVRGQTLRLLKSGRHNRAFYQRLWETVLAGRVWQGEMINRRKDGGLFVEEQTITPVRTADGTITHFISINHNITERREAEQALAIRTRQLEAVRAVTSEVIRELELPTLLTLIVRRAAELTGAVSGAVFLWDDATQLLTPEAWHGYGGWMKDVRVRLGEGVTGTVAERRQGMTVNDYRTSPQAQPILLTYTNITAALAEPLLYRDRLIGVITINNEGTGQSFSAPDQEVLALFANQAAIAIENARLFAERDRAAREARSLYEVARRLTTSLDLLEVLRLIAAKTTELLGTPHAQVVLWDEATLSLRLGAAHGTEAEEVQGQEFRVGEGVNGIVAQTRAPLVVNDYQAFPQRVKALSRLAADMAVPLLYQGRFLGVLNTHTTQPGSVFTPADVSLLTTFADQAAIAIENARLFAEVQQAMHDIQRAQAEAVRAETLRTLGQMAAGIAHDLNNTFATLLGQVELQKLRATDPTVERGLAILETAALDGAQIVQRLLNFARPQGTSRLGPVEVAPIVRDAVELTRPRWKDDPERRGVTIRMNLELPILPPVLGNAVELREALTNLIFNAVDAMPHGGTLTLRGQLVDSSSSQLGERTALPSQSTNGSMDQWTSWVELSVSDTGIGMPPEVQARLFEPFFTTKGVRGTGLGLAAVYGIMERHGGRIEVQSALGRGTTVTLAFRQATDAPFGQGEPRAPHPTAPRRLLLVDDEPLVRTTVAALLRIAGHSVTEAADGATALRLMGEAAPDVVLTDLGMPGMNGWELAKAIKAVQPTLPVVLLTGWQDHTPGEDADRQAVDVILGKPVSLSALRQAIDDLPQATPPGEGGSIE